MHKSEQASMTNHKIDCQIYHNLSLNFNQIYFIYLNWVKYSKDNIINFYLIDREVFIIQSNIYKTRSI